MYKTHHGGNRRKLRVHDSTQLEQSIEQTEDMMSLKLTYLQKMQSRNASLVSVSVAVFAVAVVALSLVVWRWFTVRTSSCLVVVRLALALDVGCQSLLFLHPAIDILKFSSTHSGTKCEFW